MKKFVERIKKCDFCQGEMKQYQSTMSLVCTDCSSLLVCNDDNCTWQPSDTYRMKMLKEEMALISLCAETEEQWDEYYKCLEELAELKERMV